jgi:hypothetical protein
VALHENRLSLDPVEDPPIPIDPGETNLTVNRDMFGKVGPVSIRRQESSNLSRFTLL